MSIRRRSGGTADPVASVRPANAALGQAVRAIRDERDITQVGLAEATGFTQSWISHIERGARNPSWSNVARLAQGLGVSVAELAARAEADVSER